VAAAWFCWYKHEGDSAMMKNARTLAMGGCVAALGTLSVVSVALGQVITPPHNCFCPPTVACDGSTLTASRYCPFPAPCYCYAILDPDTGCVIALEIECDDLV